MTKKSVARWMALACAAILTCAFFAAACSRGDGESAVAENGSSALDTDESPDSLSAEQAVYAFLAEQEGFTGYQIAATGTICAKKGFFSYTQKIRTLNVKSGDQFFSQSVSTSAIVKVAHQSFAKSVQGQSTVAYRTANTAANLALAAVETSPREDYKKLYGVAPDDVALGGVIVNPNTVRSFSADLSDKNALRYTVVLKPDSDEGLGAIRLQMKQFGGLDSLPVFSAVTLTLTLQSDFTPVSLVTEAAYSIRIAVLGELNCTQTLTAVYSDVNGTPQIPDREIFLAALG